MTPPTKRNKLLQSLYLEPHQAEALDALSAETGIAKAVLLRKAVDDLLEKPQITWTRERAKDGPPRNIHRARLVQRAKPK